MKRHSSKRGKENRGYRTPSRFLAKQTNVRIEKPKKKK